MSTHISHREEMLDFPRPTEARGLARWVSWALPSVALSGLSVAALGLVLILLQRSEILRSLFQLPVAAFWVALGAAGLGGWIAWVCRQRPGKPIPRLWALGLACGALTTAMLAFVPSLGDEPWLHALAAAELAASLCLAPRLLPMRPENRWLPWVAPLSLLGALLLVLAPAVSLGQNALEERESSVERRIRELREQADTIREISEYDWSSLTTTPELGTAAVERLKDMSLAGRLDEQAIWASAVVFRRGEALGGAGSEVIRAVADSLSGEGAPRLSAVSEPVVRWDQPQGRWVANPVFPEVSAVVGGYYREMGRLFAETKIRQNGMQAPELGDLEELHRTREQGLRNRTRTLLESWTDHWLVFRLPQHREWTGRDGLALSDVFRTSLTGGKDEGVRAADLWKLMSLPRDRARALAPQAPGCHSRAYEEEGVEYERLDCYAYEPLAEGAGASLRIEMRLVYQSRNGLFQGQEAYPVEVYLLLPVPPGEKAEPFGVHAITQLSEAVRRDWDGGFRTADRGGSVANGFSLTRSEAVLRIFGPRVRTFLSDRPAIQIRAEWRQR